jgi:DNA-binding response OmpR family regulator
MKKILLIEDDKNIQELVSWNLKEEGYVCDLAPDGETGLARAMQGGYDLLLLDVMLPGRDGFSVLRALREDGIGTPAIMVTAKNEEADKVLGLELGADDYISKPFSVRELKARVRAVMRRYGATKSSDEAVTANGSPHTDGQPKQELHIGGVAIDLAGRSVETKDGGHAELTYKEFELLKLLAENPGVVFSREKLLDTIWGYEYMGETRTVDVHVRNIRKKLGFADGEGIATVRGVGYKAVN